MIKFVFVVSSSEDEAQVSESQSRQAFPGLVAWQTGSDCPWSTWQVVQTKVKRLKGQVKCETSIAGEVCHGTAIV